MSSIQRRALYNEGDLDFDASISYDVNEYLIEAWPTLHARGRKCIWTLCQNDEEFDFSSIEEQIDDWVYEWAESATDWTLPEEEEDDEDEEEDDDDDYGYLYLDLEHFIECSWPDLTDDQVETFIELASEEEAIDWEPIYSQLDSIVKHMAKTDNTININKEDQLDSSVIEVDATTINVNAEPS